MGLTRVAINRPVFILMVILAMVVLGGVSYIFLNVELYPSISVPAVTIVTPYSGAGPEDIERLVTAPIENAVAGAPNVDTIASTSSEGQSLVTVTFTEKAQLDFAATDLERRVGSIRSVLPADAGPTSVLKFDTSQLPVLTLTYSGDLSLNELFTVAKDDIKPRLEAQPGVAAVTLTGGREREVQVLVDPVRLQSLGVSIDQISQALTRENQGLPSGTLQQGNQQSGLRFYGLWQSVDDIRNTTVTSRSGVPIRIQSVAEVADTYKDVATRTFFNGREAIGFTITKQSSANEVATVDAVRSALTGLRKTLPAGTDLAVISDTSVITRHSLEGVQRSLIEAVFLTALVLLVFLHTARSTLIVLFAIPTSLISTFLVMNILGFTLNIMSSMALVLVVGVLVDDSIVVLENIARHLEMGKTPRESALVGRSEIGMAAIAITLVDVVVFTPTAFLSGTVGAFFRQFGLVIASATLLSLFISFTLTPMLSSRWLSQASLEPGGGPWGWLIRRSERGLDRLRLWYTGMLRWALAHRCVPVAVAVGALVASFALIPLGFIKAEFA
ncbi:MAG: efflux RND transporter permease subunit, partial [Chloroflexi bacterium]|nr:efflux RND transporter permease subunit [Chloroflexota bacterium]